MSSDTFAPGAVVVVRDEEWLVTQTEETADGPVLDVEGLSDLVRGTNATFFPIIDTREVIVFLTKGPTGAAVQRPGPMPVRGHCCPEQSSSRRMESRRK